MINTLTGLGKWLLMIPFAAFGIMHLLGADKMAGMVPIPGGSLWVYLTGLGMIAFAASIVLGKYDKLGAILTALMLVVFILTLHLPAAMKGDQMAVMGLLKDLGLAGGALLYAGSYAKDGSYAS